MNFGMPSVDIVIPAYNEQGHLDGALDAALGQEYAGELRVLVVDAGSSDRTLELAEQRAADDSRVRVVAGRGRLTTPEALNAALEVADGEVFARVDAHGAPARDFVARGVDVLREEGDRVAGAGGLPRYRGDGRFQRAFTIARSSKLGVGGSVYAAGGRSFADTIPWGIYRREALLEVGGFDPAMNHGEDEELNWRLRRAGWSLVLDPAISFDYTPRSSLASAYRQYRNYGEARVRVVRAHPDFLRARHLAPSALVLGLGSLAALAPFSRRACRGLAAATGVYGLAAAGAGVGLTRKSEPELAPLVAACFPALHFGYGVGMLREGLLSLLRRPPVSLSSERG